MFVAEDTLDCSVSEPEVEKENVGDVQLNAYANDEHQIDFVKKTFRMPSQPSSAENIAQYAIEAGLNGKLYFLWFAMHKYIYNYFQFYQNHAQMKLIWMLLNAPSIVVFLNQMLQKKCRPWPVECHR